MSSEKELKLKLSVYKFVDLIELIQNKNKLAFKFLRFVPICFNAYFNSYRWNISKKLKKNTNTILSLIYYFNPTYKGSYKSDPTNIRIGLTKEQYELYISSIHNMKSIENDIIKNVYKFVDLSELINNKNKLNFDFINDIIPICANIRYSFELNNYGCSEIFEQTSDNISYLFSCIDAITPNKGNPTSIKVGFSKEQYDLYISLINNEKKIEEKKEEIFYIKLDELVKNKDKFDLTFENLIPLYSNLSYLPDGIYGYKGSERFRKSTFAIGCLIKFSELSFKGPCKIESTNVKIGFSKEQYEMYQKLINTDVYKYVNLTEIIENKYKLNSIFTSLTPICSNFTYSCELKCYSLCNEFKKGSINIFEIMYYMDPEYKGDPTNIKLGLSKEQYEMYEKLISVITPKIIYPEKGFYYNYKHTDTSIVNNCCKVLEIAHDTMSLDFNSLVIYHPLNSEAKVYKEGRHCDAKPVKSFMEDVFYNSKLCKRFTKITDEKLISQLEKIYDQLYNKKIQTIDEEFEHIFD